MGQAEEQDPMMTHYYGDDCPGGHLDQEEMQWIDYDGAAALKHAMEREAKDRKLWECPVCYVTLDRSDVLHPCAMAQRASR
jgi:hypothetical protein